MMRDDTVAVVGAGVVGAPRFRAQFDTTTDAYSFEEALKLSRGTTGIPTSHSWCEAQAASVPSVCTVRRATSAPISIPVVCPDTPNGTWPPLRWHGSANRSARFAPKSRTLVGMAERV